MFNDLSPQPREKRPLEGGGSAAAAAQLPPDQSKKKRRGAAAPPPTVVIDEQDRILHAVVQQRKSIFVTGAAGTGKTYLLHRIVAGLRDSAGLRSGVHVTASTAAAATRINGVTLHSFMGLPRDAHRITSASLLGQECYKKQVQCCSPVSTVCP